MKHTYDKEANAIYIYLCEKPYSFGRRLDDERSIDYSEDGIPIGIELLHVSSGVNVTGLPETEEVTRVLDGISIPSYYLESMTDNQVVFTGTSSIHVCYSSSDDPSYMRDETPQCTFVHTRQNPKSVRIPELEEVTA